MDDKMEFVVFCIENLAETTGLDGGAVYRMLAEDTNILVDYLLPNCEVLHTQGRAYIMEDLLDVMREKGIAV